MKRLGTGRFRVHGHGGRRKKGVHGVLDRPGSSASPEPAEAPQQGEPWVTWHRSGNPHTLAAQLREAIDADDPEDIADLVDLVAYSDWDEAGTAAGWQAWAAEAAGAIATDIEIAKLGPLQSALEHYVARRLAKLGWSPDDLTDPRLAPR